MRGYLSAMLLGVGVLTNACHAEVRNDKADDIIEPYSENAYHSEAGRTYHRHARDHARIMNERSRAGLPLRDDVYREHVTAIRSDLDGSMKHHAKLHEAVKNDAKAEKLAATIKECDSKALAQTEQLEQMASKGAVDPAAIQKFCAEIEKELSMAENAEANLAQSLNVTPAQRVGSTTPTSAKPYTTAKPVAPETPVASNK